MPPIHIKPGWILFFLCLTLLLGTGQLYAQPMGTDDLYNTLEDLPLTSAVLENDQYSEAGLPGLFEITQPPQNGTATINVDGTVTYSPDADFQGQDHYSYRICDLFNHCDEAIVQINVDPVNDAPLTGDDVDSTMEDTPVTTFVLGNDDDSKDPGSVLLATGLSIAVPPVRGAVSINPDGSIVYMPDPDYYGPDIYTYSVCDTGSPPPGLCTEATVLIHVAPVNDQPLAVNDTVFTWEDETYAAAVAANDEDPHDPYGGPDPNTISFAGVPANGTAIIDAVAGSIIYTPAPHFNGNDSILYIVCDVGYPLPAKCDTGWMFVTVGPVNDPPSVLNDVDQTDEDQPRITDVLANDSDTLDAMGGINSTSLEVITDPLFGTANVTAAGKIRYKPDPDYSGTDTYAYKVCDIGYGFPDMIKCDTAQVQITVLPVNDRPVAVNDSANGPHSTPLSVHLLSNDFDVDSDLDTDGLLLLTMTSNGSTGYDAFNKKILFQPNPGWCGFDSLQYQLCDVEGACDTASVFIEILCDLPEANDDVLVVQENQSDVAAVLLNDFGGSADLDPASLTISVQPAYGSAFADAMTGMITYQPSPGWCGSDQLTYSVCDLNSYCDQAKVSLEVVCDPFAVADDVQETLGAVPVVVPILDNDDPGANPACVEILTAPHGGVADLNSDGSLLYHPYAGYSGEDCFDYSVCDTMGVVSGQAQVCVRVSPPIVSIPEVFTPNADGINEELIIAGLEYYPYNKIMIFNRWENLVYETSGYNNDWRGTWQQNGQPLPDGTYYVLVYLDTREGDAKPVSSFTTIHR